MHNYDKKGPELFIVTEELLQGLENFAGICRKQRNYDYSELLTSAKVACSKVPTITPEVNSLATDIRNLSKKMADMADRIELLFPMVKKNEEINNLAHLQK